jgi:flagellar biosynthesis/type III secretory pathway M-ring protein FliF/YscJ
VEELLAPELSDEQRMREKIKEEVLRMIHDDPEGAALIVRSWLFQDAD